MSGSIVGIERSRWSRFRAFGIVGAIIALVLSSFVALPGASWAEANSNIVVKDIVLATDDGNQATVKEKLTLSGKWDASNAAPKPGDSFTIGLPVELGFKEAITFPLPGTDGESWGLCVTDPDTNTATCTLSDLVNDLPEDVWGTFTFEVDAVKDTTEEELVFNLNGIGSLVDLPGEGGIDDGVTLPTNWSKKGSLNVNKWSMTWTIDLPGASLVGNEVVNVLDDLSDNHVLCEPLQLRVETWRGDKKVGDVNSLAALNEQVDAPYDFGIVLTAPEAGFDANLTYRIIYGTCTTNGQIDPQGTNYTNNAYVDVFGESSGNIGVEQNWSGPSASVKKSGRILAGADREGKVEWTVEFSGDEVFDKKTFTLTDTLTGAHELCQVDGGYGVEGLTLQEQYGPSNHKVTTIDAATVARTVKAASKQSLEVEFTIADSEFAFKPSGYIYVLKYRTCASADGLPDNGSTFSNQAGIDTKLSNPASVTVKHTGGKKGSINTKFVTLDGEEHYPQTTMNWAVTIPGSDIENVNSALTLEDVLSESMAVCGTSDDIKARLGLKVEAQDQISGGGLKTVDLTANTSAAIDGQKITLTIDNPTHTMPDGSTKAGFSREYVYVVSYTTCTASGGMDAKGTEYSNAVSFNGKSYTTSFKQNNSASGTGQGVKRGSISIDKMLTANAGAAFVPADAAFTVHVKEFAPNATAPETEYDLTVPLNGDPVSGMNARGKGWTIQLSEPTMPTIPGVNFGTPKFHASEGVVPSETGDTAIAALNPGKNISVTLENTANLGSVNISKELIGGAADLVELAGYEVTAKIDTSALGTGFPKQADRVVTVNVDGPTVIENLPIGATVTFTEAKPVDTDLLTWAAPVISPASIVIDETHVAAPAAIIVTNQAERTVGTFSITKKVTGAEAANPAVPATVEVTATWNNEGTPGQKTLTVPTDGTVVPLGEQLLIGTVVTLTEKSLADGQGIAWGAPTWSGTGVAIAEDGSASATIGRDAAAQVVLENHAATSTAGLNLIKQVGGEAAGAVDADTEFSVRASWDLGNDPQQKELTINSQTPTPLGVELPAGTVVTFTEIDRPAIDGVDWGSIVFSGDDVAMISDASAEVIIADQQGTATLVTVTNEATWTPGTFSLAKKVDGVPLDNADVPEKVTVVATWFVDGEAQSKNMELPTDGTQVPFGEELPFETQVVLTELDPSTSARFTWATPTWNGEGIEAAADGSAVLIIGAGVDHAVEITNTAVETLGSLAVTKQLAGLGAADVASGIEFPVIATWTDLMGETQKRELTVTAGATTVLQGLPLGTEVTIVEGDRPDAGELAKWVSAEWTTESDSVELTAEGTEAVITVTGAADTAAALTLTNSYEQIPEVSDGGEEKPKENSTPKTGDDSNGGLATTGGKGLGLLAALGVVLLAGGGVMLLRRRRTA